MLYAIARTTSYALFLTMAVLPHGPGHPELSSQGMARKSTVIHCKYTYIDNRVGRAKSQLRGKLHACALSKTAGVVISRVQGLRYDAGLAVPVLVS